MPFKAGVHQGEHKRAAAAQGTGVQVVSKLEKLKMLPDAECVNSNGVALRVVAREKVLGGERNALVKAALVGPETLVKLGAEGSRALLCRPGSDFVLSARCSQEIDVEEGLVLLGEAQRLSLHVCEDESYEWVPFEHPGDDQALASVSIEAQLLKPPPHGERIELDARHLGRDLAKRLFDEIVSDNEIFMYSHEGVPLVLRTVGCRFPDDHDDDTEDDLGGMQDIALGADSAADDVSMSTSDDASVKAPEVLRGVRSDGHCFRGIVSARTRVYVSASTVFASSATQRAVCEGLRLQHVEHPPTRAPKNVVHVHTSDGEVFPVHRTLLRSCITLTKIVRDIKTDEVC